ncbi:PAS domain S-box protein [Ferruginibacter albus]|uniref:PAS domain S-box protein n=1 Tax=Ferruginibacter albus TaxID=2875540 RepID=UPI001CC3E4F7|nr:PAS domain S-box protein [Ferruginibacter albus]UAY51546.1 PAS domain S-box protein [Ferruginibacter albus]
MSKLLKILILEDSMLDAEMVQRSLKKENLVCEFIIAQSRQEYVSALNEEDPDVILADNSLPQFDATEALKLIRQRSLYTPFIMVTGSISEEFAVDIIKHGANDYILKDRLIRLPSAITSALKQEQAEREKEKALKKLIQSEEKFRNLLESAPDAMVIVNEKGTILLINAQTEELFGYTREEVASKPLEVLIDNEFDEAYSLRNVSHLKKLQKKQPKGAWEFYCRKKEGRTFPVEIRVNPLETSEGQLIIVAIRDITERKKSEQILHQMEQEILKQQIQEQKRISRAIIKAQEKERNHIGQELHDNVNQILVSSKLYLDIAGKSNDIVKELVKYPIELIESSIAEIRQLTRRYVTPLKNINLKDLIVALLSNISSNTSTKTNLSYKLTEEIEDDLKLNIYRIIQEQLNNIVKHADAKNISVSLSINKENIEINVTDDGKGFDVKKKRDGIGISNIINRIESFNGNINIKSTPGQGSKIDILLPY